jgi:hypothetical protein
VEYLGQIVSQNGVQIDPNKIEVRKYWPFPKTLKTLHDFLGLVGYYKKFVKVMVNCHPISFLVKK